MAEFSQKPGSGEPAPLDINLDVPHDWTPLSSSEIYADAPLAIQERGALGEDKEVYRRKLLGEQRELLKAIVFYRAG